MISEKKWEEEQAAHTLLEAEKIKDNPQLLSGAKRVLQETVENGNQAINILNRLDGTTNQNERKEIQTPNKIVTGADIEMQRKNITVPGR